MPTDNQHLQKTLEEKIRQVSSTADLIPSVIIIHSLPDLKILFMSKLGLDLIGKTWNDIKSMSVGEFESNFMNAEVQKDATPKILEMLQSNTDVSASYFQQVRTSATREWDWYKSVSRVLMRDDENRPMAFITISQQIDPEHFFTSKAARLLEENAFLKKHYQQFHSLTTRERMILKLLAAGNSAPQIAKELHISVATAETHRKKVRKKLGVRNSHDLGMYARAFDLI